MNFFVNIEMRDYCAKNGPYTTYQEAESRQTQLRAIDDGYHYRRIWIETDKGEEILPLERKHVEIVQDWLEKQDTYYCTLAIFKPQNSTIHEPCLPIRQDFVQKVEFHRELIEMLNGRGMLHVGIDQFGRRVEATMWRF